MEHIAALCAYIVLNWSVYPPSEVAQGVCADVGAAALVEGLPPELALALAYTESRFNPLAKSARGALGPWQVLPAYYCPKGRARGCDLVAAGARALVRFRDKYGPTWRAALCHWNSGNHCYRRSRLFARIVLGRAHELTSNAGRLGCGI